MRLDRRLRVPALAAFVAVLLLLGSLPASAAGPKRIFIVKSDEKGNGQAGVTFELYLDANGNGVRDATDPFMQSKVTDATGHATFAPMPPGQYIVHEVTPAGYADNPDKSVVIPNAKGPGPTVVFQNTPLPKNNRVNNPTGEKSIDDGTHISDFAPTIAVAPNGTDLLVAWNDPVGFYTPGEPSSSNTARSSNGGRTWVQTGKLPTNSDTQVNFGGPFVIRDPTRDRWLVASNGFEDTPDGFASQILVNASGGGTSFWRDPFVAIDLEPGSDDFAHTPTLAEDPNGTLYLGFVLSHGNGTSQPMVARSTDGGEEWGSPVALSPSGENDFLSLGVGRDHAIHAAWREQTSSSTFQIRYSTSTDGGAHWSAPTPVGTGLPVTGTPSTCVGSGRPSILGQIAATSGPSIAVSPLDPNRLFATFDVHGAGGDEADVEVYTSDDGGTTWTELPAVSSQAGMPQFFPQVGVTGDGRVAVTYYDVASPTQIGVSMSVYSAFDGEPIQSIPITRQGFAPWQMNPSFDTDIATCHGMDPFHFAALGSGFFVAWTDGRDVGPAGNHGIDPNIYFAHTEGPNLPSNLSASVGRTASALKVAGKVLPAPLEGAKVIITLFHGDGGGFSRIARTTARTGAGGAWSTSFPRPDGTCRIVVEFGGSEGRAPSAPITKTFDC